ncbi:MAG: hypothetical protein LBE22_07805 [Azoarcus sp.]|nr:hypothetical protein [Azoarcus sp.]
MKYPLLAAALLALTVSACDGKKEDTSTVSESVATPPTEEQAPATASDAQMVTEPPVAVVGADAAPAPVEEAPAPEAAAPEAEAK